MPGFETGRRNMNLCYGLTYFVGDWTHFLKPCEFVSMGWFFNSRSIFVRLLSHGRAAMPLDDDTVYATQLESWHRGGVLQILPCGSSCTAKPATARRGRPE